MIDTLNLQEERNTLQLKKNLSPYLTMGMDEHR